MTKVLRLGAASLSVAVLCLASVPAFAEGGTGSNSGNGDSTKTNSSTTSGTSAEKTHDTATNRVQSSKPTAVKEQEQEKVAAAKEKACEVRKQAASNIQGRVVNRGQKRLDAYNQIAQKVENFYTTKNLSISNYSALVADVNAKKAAAQSAVDTVKSDAAQTSSVTCGDGQGKAAVEKFKQDLKAEQDALKAYKSSIKTLIQAVKAAKSVSTGSQTQ